MADSDPPLNARRFRLWSGAFLRVYLGLSVALWLMQDLVLFPGMYRSATNEKMLVGWNRVLVPGPGPDVRVLHTDPAFDRVVVMAHGNGDFASDMILYGQVLQEEGWDFAVFEYRRYDDAPGWPGEENFAADLRAVLEWLPSQGWSMDRTVVHGRSIGGGVAVAGAHDADVAGFVLESTFDSVADVARRRLPTALLPVRLLLAHDFDNFRLAERDVPVFQVHDRADTIIPIGRAHALRDALQNVTFMESEGHGHGTPLVFVVPEMREAWLAWLDDVAPASE